MRQTRLDDSVNEQTSDESRIPPPSGDPRALSAYLASALTNLTAEEKVTMNRVQGVIEEVCREANVTVYRPGQHTDPDDHPDVLPSAVYSTDREQVLKADFLILIADPPSHGAGIEGEIASRALMPILLIKPEGARVSRMLLGLPGKKYPLEATEETLAERLREALAELRPRISRRRHLKPQVDRLMIGHRITQLREQRGLSRQDLANILNIEPDEVTELETKPLHISNPSLMLLLGLSEVFELPLAEFVDPALFLATNEALARVVMEGDLGVLSAVDARDTRGDLPMSESDKRTILRRRLRRAAESL